MSQGVISVEFIADITDLLSGVQQIIDEVSSVGDTAGVVGDLSASLSEASAMAGDLASSVASVADGAGAITGVATSVSELDTSLSGVATTASEASSSLASVSDATGPIIEATSSVTALGDALTNVATTASETASSVSMSMSEAAASASEAAAATGEAGAAGGTDFMGGMAKAGMGLMAVQAGVNMVQQAFQQATGPFGNFQAQMTQLVTGAGESESALAGVQQGIEQMSVATGTSTDQLSAGMYLIESAGYHGASGLAVLQSAAEGAKVGGADLATVANAVTSALNAYGLQGKDSASITNQLIATVAAGKMKMQDLAGALAAVLPVASAAGISFAQVGGAIATMTAMGMTAQNASQNLANAIRSLQAPNAQAVTEMQAMGLNANQVSMQLGQKGLTGTLQEISQAIIAHMGPAGTVLQSAFKASASAAAAAKAEIAAMPKSLQGVAQQFLSGSLSTKQWSKDISGLDPITQHMMQQFATTAKQTDSFNSLLTKGGPAAQTYTAALSKITGGSTGMNVALMLTGTHMSTFQANVNAVAAAAKHGGTSITGWNLVQQDFNQQMAISSAKTQVFWINVGQQLAPVVLALMGALDSAGAALGNFVSWLNQGSVPATALKIVFIALGGAILGFVASAIPALVAGFIAWAAGAWAAAAGTIVAAAPFILIGAAIALLVVGIVLLIQHWGQVVAFMKGVWQGFASGFMNALHAVGAFFANIWGGIVSFFVGVFNRFKPLFVALGIIMAIAFSPLIIAIAAIAAPWVGLYLLVTHFQQIMAFLRSFLATIWAAIVHVFQAAIQTVVGWFQWLYNHNHYFQDLVDLIRKIVTAFVAWFENAWKTTIANVVALWNGIKDVASTVFTAIVTVITNVWNTVISWIESAWNREVTGLQAIWGKISSTATSIFTSIASFLHGIWDKIVKAVTTAWSNISSIFTSAYSTYVEPPLLTIRTSIINFFTNLAKTAISWGQNLISGFVSGITGSIGKVTGAVQGVMGKVAGFLGFHSPSKEGPGQDLDIWGPNLVKGFVAGLDHGVPLVQAAVTHLIQPATALGTSNSNAPRGGNAGQASGNPEIHVHVHLDGQEMTDQLMTHMVSTVRSNGPVGRAA